jgi:hypothetical protein
MQTLTGLGLDLKKKQPQYTNKLDQSSDNDMRLQWLLNSFVFFNILQLVGIWGLGYLDKRKKKILVYSPPPSEGETGQEHVKFREGGEWSHGAISLPGPSTDDSPVPQQRVPLLSSHTNSSMDDGYVLQPAPGTCLTLPKKITRAEMKRGRIFAWMCAGVFLFSWILFLATSILKIRSKKEREGSL